MAAFLFFRADERAWPLGQAGFFASLRDPEGAQHRIFTLQIILFGLFEWRAGGKGREGGRPGLGGPLNPAPAAAGPRGPSHAPPQPQGPFPKARWPPPPA